MSGPGHRRTPEAGIVASSSAETLKIPTDQNLYLWAISFVAAFILTYTFPLLNRGVGPAGTFWIYAGICFAGSLLIRWRLPETKGQTLEEIEEALTS